MRRLAYAPKAYIFIRSNNMGGRIYNVSDDCVRGSVTQNLGDVSTLSFSLRNRYKKWLRDGDTGQLIFTPMDLVTCWLQRLPGQPIQQFTGYLDSVPYYQGYPGDAPFTATCTLKKLAYTWFDPGLQFFQTWLIQNGWVFDPTSGEVTNPTLNWQSQTTNATNFGTATADAGFGKLLRSFMVDVAGWDGADVLVSDLPLDLPKAAAALFKSVNTAAQQELDSLATYFNAAMGVKVVNGSAVSASSTGTTDTLSQAGEVAVAIKSAATSANINPLALAYAAVVLSNLNPSYSHPSSATDQYWGYGLYALRPKIVSVIGTDPISGLSSGLTAPGSDGKHIKAGGKTYTIDDMADPNKASTAMCALLNAAPGAIGFRKAAANNDTTSITAWIRAALGANRQLPSVDPTQAFEQAKQLLGTALPVASNTAGLPNVDVSTIDWTSSQLQKLLNPQEKATVRDNYQGKKKPWLAGLLYQIKTYLPNVRIAVQPTGVVQLTDTMMYVTGAQADLQKLQSTLSQDQYIDKVESKNDPAFKSTPADGLYITESSAPPKGHTIADPTNAGTAGQTASGVGTDNGYVSWESLSTFAATSAFAANFSFPTDIIESNLLVGDKALMNDMSTLDAIKQFCAASMRTFRTMPDGRFLAFYPDYFGAYRDPYWKIENIELTDFGIVLNDEQLATHVYVTGDTMIFNNQIDLIEQIGTRGVATINQAMMLPSFITPWDPKQSKTALNDLRNAWDFLQHYGARPYKEDQPMIRNAAFEFLYAWAKFMLKWAKLFQTTVSFTFQPEVMAGGIIEFPDHNVQMFVESVTHSWDYQSGFTTDATLSAPSLPKSLRKAGKQMPGFALAGVRTPGLDGAS